MKLIIAALVMTGLVHQERPADGKNDAKPTRRQRAEPQEKPATSKPMFSGPQVGERLPALKVRLLGEKEPKELVASHKGKPVQVIFMHKVARIAFQLIKPVTEFAAKHEKDKQFRTVLVFLTDDPPAMDKQMRAIAGYLPKSVLVGVSPDGSNGPGNYGLNRNAMMTLLLGKGDKVTANFAMGQPSFAVDGPRMAKATAELLKVPVPNYSEMANANMNRRQVDRKLARMVNPLLGGKWTDEEATAKIAEIEKYVGDNRRLKTDLGTMIARIAPTGRAKMISNAKVKAKFEEWKKLAPRQMRGRGMRVQNDPMIRVLFQPFLARGAEAQEVTDAAAKIVDYAKKNPATKAQIAGICQRIVDAGRLEGYGTAKAQEFIKKWAKEFADK